MSSTINRVMLPPTYFLSELSIALLCRCLDDQGLLNRSFKIDELKKVATRLGLKPFQQQDVFEELLLLEIIYSISKESRRTRVNPQLNYYLNAELIVQALIGRFSEYVIGKRLCKFEIDGEMFDAGFVKNNAEVFTAIMSRITEYLAKNDDSQEPYIPSFIRLYECMGTADGRDFFTKIKIGSKLTTENTDASEPIFYIPKYVVLNKQELDDAWIPDYQRICVCIN